VKDPARERKRITRRLLKLLTPYRWWIAAGVLLSFATVGSSIGLMAMSAYLISKAAITTEIVDLSLLITWVRFFAIARAAFRYIERVITHQTTFRILTHLRVWFYQAIEPLAPARLQTYRSGDLLARIITDIETLENFYVRVAIPPLAAALVTALACAILGSFDLWLGIALLVFLALTGIALPWVSRWLSRRPAAYSIAGRAELNSVLVDQIQGISDLLVYGQEREQQTRIIQLDHALNRSQEHLATIRGMTDGLAALLTSLAGLTILFLAIPLVSAGRIQGVYLALLPLAAIASFEAVQPLSLAYQNLESSQSAARRLFEMVDTVPGIPDTGQPSPRPHDNSLEFHNLHFRYAENEPPVLSGVTFFIPDGGCTTVIGPSGAGKSTLVNLLLRFWDYHEGEIRIGGHELHDYSPEDVRKLLSVVSQQIHLFNGSLRDNLWLANPDASEAQMIEACQQAQLHDFIQALPEGYGTMIGENGLLLSGGERQRLALARAFLKNAPILILDEATANLDALTEEKIITALEPFINGRTTMIISHQRSMLEPGSQVILLENGRIIASAG
jgi:ATP-binding cassette, subfamily C, bacterial CydC